MIALAAFAIVMLIEYDGLVATMTNSFHGLLRSYWEVFHSSALTLFHGDEGKTNFWVIVGFTQAFYFTTFGLIVYS